MNGNENPFWDWNNGTSSGSPVPPSQPETAPSQPESAPSSPVVETGGGSQPESSDSSSSTSPVVESGSSRGGSSGSSSDRIIKFSSLEGAGDQAKKLNEVTGLGADVTIKLKQVIEELIGYWVGDSAKEHLNNLIVLQNALYDLTKFSMNLSCSAISTIRNTQLREQAAGGKNVTIIGSPVMTDMPISYKVDANISNTGAVQVDTEQMKVGLSKLNSVINSFNEFASEFASSKKALDGCWESGQKADFDASCDKFEQNKQSYSENLSKAKDNLQAAIQVWDSGQKPM